MLKVGIVGATGYTGVELLRLLLPHPNVEVVCITSRGEAGLAIDSLYPSLRGHTDLCFVAPDVEQLAACDAVFFATPHGVAQSMVPALLDRNVRVVDLSADFRIKDVPLWEKWYNQPHGCPDRIDSAVYGLPEVNREQIKGAQLLACPGCYPTSVQLGLIPLLEAGVTEPQGIVVNSASGASGAGRQAKVDNLLMEISDSFKAYASAGHRHLPEIEQGLRAVQASSQSPAEITFVPHLLPTIRGIHSTMYVTVKDRSVDLQSLFENRYANEPFVDVLPAGSHPQTRTVKGSNMCRMAVCRPQDRDTVVVMSVIDNLTKGAAGQAVQNFNIMFGLDETAGLDGIALLP